MQDLIYDWNGPQTSLGQVEVELLDATLTEGLNAPQVWPPGRDARARLVRRMAGLGIQAVELAPEDLDHVLPDVAHSPRPVCPIPARPEAVERVAQAARRALTEAEIRVEPTEGMEACVELAHRLGVRATVAIPGAGTMPPVKLAGVLRRASECRADWVQLEDEEGCCTEAGVERLVGFSLKLLGSSRLAWSSGNADWLGLTRASAAVRAGARRLRGSILGLGRRELTPIDLLLVNLKLEESWLGPTEGLVGYCREAAACLGVEIPCNYPVSGADAFRTATGVHAAAVRKALLQGDPVLADRVYSGVPAGVFGARQTIEVGPMAGRANALHWLEQHGIEASSVNVERVLAAAKVADHTLTDLEVYLALQLI